MAQRRRQTNYGGDRGDEYNYCPPEAEVSIVAPASPPEIAWLEQLVEPFGGQQPVDRLTPEAIFERTWAPRLSSPAAWSACGRSRRPQAAKNAS